MSQYILYGGSVTRAIINEMVMLEGGLDYTLRTVDIFKNEHRTEEFLKDNPEGMVPVLMTPEGVRLYETAAINLYLADHHRLADLEPAPDDPDRGRFLSALFYITGELEPAFKRYYYPHRYAKDPADTARAKKLARNHVMNRLEVIDQRLRNTGPYLLGSRFSFADITLAYWVSEFSDQPVIASCQAVKKHWQLVRSRPRLKELFDRLVQMQQDYKKRQEAGDGIR